MTRAKGTPWYAEGLRFECVNCGSCCCGEAGHIWVTNADIERMAEAIGMTPENFRERHVREVKGRLSLREKPNGDCVMYDNGCRVYEVRATQCASWPFWTGNLESEDAWKEAAGRCPGMGNGRVYSPDEIRRLATPHGQARAL